MTSKLTPYPVEYLEITFIEENADIENYIKLQCEQILPFASSEVFYAPLISACQLTEVTEENNVKKVIEMRLNVEGSNFNYQPGDTIGILPQNCEKEINEIIERLNYNEIADKLFTVSVKETNTKKKYKIPPHIPVIGTIRNLLLNNLDVRGFPKKTFLRALSKYTTNEEEANQLNELCIQGTEKYKNFVEDYVPLLEILKIFQSCFPPFPILLEHLPRLLPRPYSITCSPLQFNPAYSEIHFIFSLTTLPKNYSGVCTKWLEKFINNSENVKIPIYLRNSNNFVLPETSSTNLILIANGTGIAPFLSFLRHRAITSKMKLSTLWLFYGCRYSNHDFLYKNEINEYVETGVITKLFTNFSKESTTKYVQDKILQNEQKFVDMLDNDCILYVCGSKNMTRDVFQTIIKCVQDIQVCSSKEAEIIVNELKTNNQYIEDIWD